MAKIGLLLCSGGMSTTLIAKALNEKTNIDWEAKGINLSSDWIEFVKSNDIAVILISPQIRFQHDMIVEKVDNSIPIVSIQPQNYIVSKVDELIKSISEYL